MSAIERAEEDVRKGDYGMARQRLKGYLATKGYNADVLKRLGEISQMMHDPYEAGRIWFITPVEGAHHEYCIDVFVNRSGAEPWVMVEQMPGWARTMAWEEFPPTVQARLQASRIDRVLADLQRGIRKKPSPLAPGGRAAMIVFFTLAAVFAGLCAIGIFQVIRWLWRS